MPSTYTGSMVNTQPPSGLPSFTAAPILNLPTDGDALNASSILQAFKVCADFIDFFRLKLAPFVGIRTWDAGIAFVAGDIVRYATDGYYYRCTSGVTGGTGPASDTAHWTRFAIDLGTLSGQVASGFAVTTGDATISACHALTNPASTYKTLVFNMHIGADDTQVITLSGAAAFANTALAGVAQRSTGTNYIVGDSIQVGVSGNVITITLDAGGIGGSGGDLNLVVYGY